MFVYHPALWAPLLPGGGELKLLSSFDTPSIEILYLLNIGIITLTHNRIKKNKRLPEDILLVY